MAKGNTGGRGLNLKAKLDIAEAKRNGQDLLKTLKELSIASAKATAGTGVGNAKAFDTKPLTEYQAGLLKIKQEALEFAKSEAARKKAERDASLATQAALKEGVRIKREQIAAEKALKAEQAKRKPTQISNSQAEIDAYKKATQGSMLYTSAINAQTVARAKLNATAANAAVTNGTLNNGITYNTQATQQQTSATNQNVLSKKQLAQMLAEEKYRQQQATAELKNNAREMLNAKGSLEQRRAALIRLNTAYDRLSKTERESASGNRLANVIKNVTDQVKQLEAATGRAQRNVGNYPNAFSKIGSDANKLTDTVKGSKGIFGQLFESISSGALSVLAPLALIGAAWTAVKAIFSHNVEISDAFADVRRTAKLSNDEVNNLADTLKGLDTRTNLEGLLDIGFIGGRLGVSKSELPEFIKQVDELAVVLKKELPGGAEAVAESLGRIVTIYKVTKAEGVSLGTALSKVGSNMLELAHSGPVTVKYLQDFTLGVAGTAASAKLSIPVISAYGAVLGESGQIASSAALSVTRLVTGLTTKTGKYAAIAQLADSTLTVEKFTKIVNTDTKLALDLFFKGLKAGNPVATEFAARLGSVGITTGKVTNAVKILAENQDKLANRIEKGTIAFEDGISVAHNFEIANDTLGASVDKLGNSVVNLTTNPNSNMYNFFKGLIDGSTKAVNALGILIATVEGLTTDPKKFIGDSAAKSRAETLNKINEEAKRIAASAYKDKDTDVDGERLSILKEEVKIRDVINTQYLKAKIAYENTNTKDRSIADTYALQEIETKLQKQVALVRELNKLRNRGKVDVIGTGEIVPDADADVRTTDAIRAEIKALELANKKLGVESKQFKSNVKDIVALRKELKIALGGKDTEGIAAENQYATALKARNNLQAQISALTKKGTDRQLSADEQELESVKDKYKKMLDAANAFNNDPKNKAKGLRVDAGGLSVAQDREETALRDKQDTAKLKVSLDEQKKLYDDYEEYKTKVGEENAKTRYASLVDTDRTYLQSLEAQLDAITNPQKSKGGAEVDTAGNTLKIKLLSEEIAAEKLLQQKKNDDIYADAYQSAMTNAQALLAIEADYQSKRNALGKDASAEQLKNLQREKDNRIRNQNNANAEEESGYADLMENLDEMTRGAAIKAFELQKEYYTKQYKAKLITAKEYADKIAQLNGEIDNLNGDNIFKGISNAIKRYKEAKKAFDKSKSDDDAIGVLDARAEMFSKIGEGAEAAAVGLSGLAGIFDDLGVGGEKLQVVLKGVSGVLEGAGQISKGISSGDPVAVVSGSIKLLGSAIDLFNGKDRKLNRKIADYKLQLDSLGKAYAQLDRQVNNSVGESYYDDSAAQIENLKAQQAELVKMRDAERSKKKSDQDKINEYQNQIDEIPNKIEDITKAISQTLIQTNFKDLSNSLADALSDAFAAGEDSAKAFDDVFDKVIVNAVKNSLKLKILDPIVKKFTDDLTAYASGNDNSVIGFDFEKYRALLAAGGKLVTAGLDQIKDYFPDTLTDPANNGTLSGSIQAITQTQADVLSGNIVGLRVTQLDTNNILRPIGKTMGDIFLIAKGNFDLNVKIEANTLRSANNTDRLENMESALVSINKKMDNNKSALTGTGR